MTQDELGFKIQQEDVIKNLKYRIIQLEKGAHLVGEGIKASSLPKNEKDSLIELLQKIIFIEKQNE